MNKLMPLLFCFMTIIAITSCRTVCSRGQCRSNCNNNDCDDYCSDDVCCESQSCNSCVDNCSSGCRSSTCRSNCVQRCTSRSRTKCEETSCSSSNCRKDCSSDCEQPCESRRCEEKKCPEPVRPTPETEPIIIEEAVVPNVIVNNTNLVNLTTHINIQNVIHNINNISTPIFVNTTNINNIGVINHPAPPPVIPPNPPIIVHVNSTNVNTGGETIVTSSPPIENKCCYVMYPKECYTENNQKRCVIKRYRECGSICTSEVIHIDRDFNAPQRCNYVPNYPYIYCGQYQQHGCGQCYSCQEGGNNPAVCSQTLGCSQACRQTISGCNSINISGGSRMSC